MSEEKRMAQGNIKRFLLSRRSVIVLEMGKNKLTINRITEHQTILKREKAEIDKIINDLDD